MTKTLKNNTGIIAILFTGVLMGALDISIVGPAIPSIERSIDIETRYLGWIFSIYVLFNLTGISLFAKLSDIFGRKNIYILSIVIFAIGSLVVAFSDNFSWLITGRAIQGFGASGIFPVASAVVGDLFPKEKRGRVLGLLGAVFGFAFIIGPVLAGTLLHYFSWNVLFLINIPIAIGIVLFAIKILPNTKVDKPGKFDWKGIVSMGLMLGLFTYGMSNLDSDDFLGSLVSLQVLPYLILTIVFFLTTLFIERRAEAPVVKTTLFYNRQIRLVAFVAIATGILQSSFVFIPNFAVGLFDVSPSTASFMLLPVVLATAFGSPLFGRIMDYTGSKMVIILGLGFDIIGFYMLSSVGNHKVLFYTAGAFIGLGLSILSGSSLRYIMLNEAEKVDRAVTQGMLTIFVSIGQLTGAALIGVIIAQSSGVSGYNAVFLYQAILLVVVALASFRFKGKEAERLTVAEG